MDTLTGLGVDSECRSGPSMDGLRMSESVNSVIHGLQWSVDYATLDITDSSKFQQLNRSV